MHKKLKFIAQLAAGLFFCTLTINAYAGMESADTFDSSTSSELGSSLLDEAYVEASKHLVTDDTPLFGTAGTIGDKDSFYKESKQTDPKKKHGENISQGEAFEPLPGFAVQDGSASLASWYGPGFNGRKTCTGDRFNQNALTLAAHKWLGEMVCVSYRNKKVTARVNDCGPYERRRGKWVPHSKRSFDLSKGLMRALTGKPAGLVDVNITHGPC